MSTITEALGLAYQQHQAGNLERAEQFYRRVLQMDPQHVDALHMLGVLAYQLERNDEAGGLIRQALHLRPDFPEASSNLGNVLQRQGKLAEAIDNWQRALQIKPDIPEVHSNLGLALLEQGYPERAITCFQQALRLRPHYAEAHNNLGVALKAQGKLAEAADSYREALRLNPDYAQARSNLAAVIPRQELPTIPAFRDPQAEQIAESIAAAHSKAGNELYAQGKLDEAVAQYRQALRQKPDYVEMYNNLGAALYQQGKLDEAVDAYQQALRFRPEYIEALNNLGAAFFGQRRLEQSAACYRQAIQINPGYAMAYKNLGATLKDQGKTDASAECYRQAVRLDPGDAETHLSLGVALAEQDQPEQAAVCYRQALRLKPDYAEAHNNLGGALKDQGRLADAVACFQKAVQCKLDYGEAHNNLGLAWLLMGKLEQGWPEYEWRSRSKEDILPHVSQPLWDGSSLVGRTILLHTEQGWGDAIQFIRYAGVIHDRGGRVAVSCSASLARLLSSSPGIDLMVPRGSPLPPFDVHAPLLSLPGLLATSEATVPAKVPYLFADADLIENWRQVLNDESHEGRTRKIGIGWQGNPAYYGDRQRSIPLTQFAPLAGLPGVQLISLQKGLGAEQVAAVADQMAVTELGPQLDRVGGTFLDTAAVMKNLDLVITSDTAIAHLAGALGVPVWVALAFVPDWRWMLHREDSPWYPSMRLFRQPDPGNWPAVFQRMAAELSQQF